MVLVSAHALRIHHALKHDSQPKQELQRCTFKAELHSIGGMPTCKLCLRNFTKWRQLRLHIGRCSCPHLGGDSFKLHPPAPDNHLLRRKAATLPQTNQAASGDQPDHFQPENFPDEQPLVLDSSFHDKLPAWDQLLNCPATKARLKQHCVICNMWVVDYRHMRQHYNKAHHQQHPSILPAALTLSKTYKSHLTGGRSCRWCGHCVGAPGRRSTQCVVLNQLAIAYCCCSANLHKQDHDASRPGSRHLQALHALQPSSECFGETRGPGQPGPSEREPQKAAALVAQSSVAVETSSFSLQPDPFQDPSMRLMAKVLLKTKNSYQAFGRTWDS